MAVLAPVGLVPTAPKPSPFPGQARSAARLRGKEATGESTSSVYKKLNYEAVFYEACSVNRAL